MTAFAASWPLLGFFNELFILLLVAWLIFKAVIIPLPIGLLNSMDSFKIALNAVWQIKSKWGVWPFITHPKATNPSNFFIFFLMAIGIS